MDVHHDRRNVRRGEKRGGRLRVRDGDDESVVALAEGRFHAIRREFRGGPDERDVPVVVFAEKAEDAAELFLSGDPGHAERNEDLFPHIG